MPSSSLVPSDPSVLLTTAGVQQFKLYYTGQLDPVKDFGSRSAVSIQKCFRTTDIDEVGDENHLTFFEMLGNFCFGGYWKKEAICWAYEFITQELKVDPERISVSVFEGFGNISKDEESYKIWKDEVGILEKNIKLAGMLDNFWGPTGNNGPCGPTTEIYIDGVEIWNIVFNEFFCDASREKLLEDKAILKPLKQKGIDTGMGLDRLTAAVQNKKSIFETDHLRPLFGLLNPSLNEKKKRVLTDHARGTAFLISDGILPSNKEAGYVLRRLLRRMMVYAEITIIRNLLNKTVELYKNFYPELNLEKILSVIDDEDKKFSRALKLGIKELEGIYSVDAITAFRLYESYGLPYEIIKELGGERARGLKKEDFDIEFKKHQEISRAGAERKFGGHGLILDTGELKASNEVELRKVIRLHTATHLLQQALRDVLGSEVQQRGSDITVERTRFDFTFNRKVTAEEIKMAEAIVNQKIKEDLPVNFAEMTKEEAMKTGALFFFREKYPEKVKVYYAGKDLASAYSKEFCGGPHVTHTSEIGQFKILKEEAVGAGIRRIRATAE